MARKILVLDTSILCCWLRVPGKDTAGTESDIWDFDRIDKLLITERAKRSTFVLPIASLIETGNHIAQCNGNRYNLAIALTDHLKNTVLASSPWAAFTDQSTLWEPKNLQELADAWPQLAVGGTSIGDATIKHVAEYYSTAGYEVEILTGDAGLKAYETTKTQLVPRRRR
jgi:hypothetical protein